MSGCGCATKAKVKETPVVNAVPVNKEKLPELTDPDRDVIVIRMCKRNDCVPQAPPPCTPKVPPIMKVTKETQYDPKDCGPEKSGKKEKGKKGGKGGKGKGGGKKGGKKGKKKK